MFKSLNHFSQEVCEHANKRKLFDLYCVVREGAGALCGLPLPFSTSCLQINWKWKTHLQTLYAHSASKFICRQGRLPHCVCSNHQVQTILNADGWQRWITSHGKQRTSVCAISNYANSNKNCWRKKSLFFPYFRRDVTLKQEVQKQILYLYATDINLYRYNFFEKKKKRMFQVFTKGWSLKAVIFFNGYLRLHSILWDLCIPALSHPVPKKKTCSAAIKAAYLHCSTCSAVYYKRRSLSSSTFWVLNTSFFYTSFKASHRAEGAT